MHYILRSNRKAIQTLIYLVQKNILPTKRAININTPPCMIPPSAGRMHQTQSTVRPNHNALCTAHRLFQRHFLTFCFQQLERILG